MSILIPMMLAAFAQDNTLSEEEKKAGWKLLFDGKTTEGWRGWKKDRFPAGGWEVVEGVLTLEKGGGGDILTVEQFENFEFTIDRKIGPGGNSGIK